MELVNKNILIVSPESWDHIFVSKHHYAVHLAKRGNSVYFLNPPGKKTQVVPTEYTGLFQIYYSGFWKGLRFFPPLVQRWNIRKVFHRIQFLAGVEFDIIWSFDNSVFFDFDALPDHVYKICHIVDLNQNFQFEKAATSASICFTPSNLILNNLKKVNRRAYFINHGLNIDYTEKIVKLPGSKKIKALYFGNLAMSYMDWKIIEDAVNQNSMVDFIFLGSNGANFELTINDTHDAKYRISYLDHVHFISKVSSKELWSYMHAADVLVIAYQQQFHKDQVNPHKMMEYLFSGKPIVATFTKEYMQFQDLIQMSANNEEWPFVFSRTIQNIEDLSQEMLRNRRKKIALENTYDKQLNRINDLING